MKKLTVTEALSLAKSQKVFSWKAPAYEGNFPYHGKAKILGVYKNIDSEITEHILKVVIIEGDNLNFAKAGGEFSDPFNQDVFHFSDSDRFVTFSIDEKS